MGTDIHIQKQARLSLSRVFKLVVSGIKHRLLRSTLTMAVILLAVAFFMSMLTEADFIKTTGRAVKKEIDQQKAPAQRLTVLFSLPSKTIFLQNLAVLKPVEIEMVAARTGSPKGEIERLSKTSARIIMYYRFFDKMDVGKRLSLIGKRKGLDIFTPLVGEKNWKIFTKSLNPLHSVKIPGSAEEFRGFLDRLESFTTSFDVVYDEWILKSKSFIFTVNKMMDNKAPERWLQKASAKELNAFVVLAVKDGFNIDFPAAKRMQDYLVDNQIRLQIMKALTSPQGRKVWASEFRAKHTLEEKLVLLSDPRAHTVLSDFKPEVINRISEQLLYSKHLEGLSDSLQGKTELDEEALLSRRQIFLLAVSFIVCMVGISNAMLMSITERFREIATMKCLGATDGFILLQFLIEAAIQGLAGGVFGMLIGLSLSFLKNYFIFGNFMVVNISLGGIMFAGIVSLFAGIFLSMVASVYPSWSASRMAPMEAMRIE